MYDQQKLRYTTLALVKGERGILDLSDNGHDARRILSAADLPSSPENLRQLHQLLLDTPNLAQHIAGVLIDPDFFNHLAGLVYREMIPVKFRDTLAGIELPNDHGIPQADLPRRLADWHILGIQFAGLEEQVVRGYAERTRMVETLATFAVACQRADLVPILGIRMGADGDGAFQQVLNELIAALRRQSAWLPGLLLRISVFNQIDRHRPVPVDIIPSTIGGVLLDGGDLDVGEFQRLLADIRREAPLLPFPLTFMLSHSIETLFGGKWQGRMENEINAQLLCSKAIQGIQEALHGSVERVS